MTTEYEQEFKRAPVERRVRLMNFYEGIGSGTLLQRIRWLFTQKRFKLILTKDSVYIYEMGNLKWHKALLFYFHWYLWARKSGCDVNMYDA